MAFDLIGHPDRDSDVPSTVTVDNVRIDPPPRSSDEFVATVLPTTASGYDDVELGDVDGDGRIDAVLASGQTGMVDVLNATPDGGFISEPVDLGTASGVPGDIALADFTGDGVSDLAIAMPGDAVVLTPLGSDVTGPAVTLIDPPAGTTVRSFSDSVTVRYSEPVRTGGPGSAIDPTAYQLQSSGPDGVFGSGDDIVYAVTTVEAIDATTFRLLVSPNGPDRDGTFRLTVSGQDPSTAVRDLAGNRLGGGSDAVTRWTVDAPLSMTTPDPASAAEGTAVSIAVDWSDAGSVGGYTASVDWGDGVVTPAGITPATANPAAGGAGGTIDATHAYGDQGVYPITVTLTDAAGGSVTASTTAVVSNAPPVVTATERVFAPEGTPVSFTLGMITDASFSRTDAGEAAAGDDLTATIDWGDGSPTIVIDPLPSTAAGGDGPTIADVVAEHAYASQGEYPITLTVGDGDGDPVVATLTAVISNTSVRFDPPSINDAIEGSAVELSVEYFDDDLASGVDPADLHTVTIDWGDGTAEAVTPVGVGDSRARIDSDHRYGDDGGYLVTVTLIDADGSTVSITATAVIAAAPPIATAGDDRVVTAGTGVDFVTATFTLRHADGTVTTSVVDGAGDRTTQTVDLNAAALDRLTITLSASGAVTEIVSCRDSRPVAIDLPAVVDEGGTITVTTTETFDRLVVAGDGVAAFDGIGTSTAIDVTDGDDDLIVGGWVVGGENVDDIRRLTTGVIAVRNVIPTLSAEPEGLVTAGAVTALRLTADDPGDDAIAGWVVDWGDGTIDVVGASGNTTGEPSGGHSAAYPTHTYAAAGSYTVRVHGFDEDYRGPAYGAGSIVTVTARGNEGGEHFVVRAGDVVLGEATATTENRTFRFAADTAVAADDLTVTFTNDEYRPDEGFDRNLRVESIDIDDVTYVTDDPSVYSTGTWTPADGIAPGYGRGDWLHAGGFFRYAGPATLDPLAVFDTAWVTDPLTIDVADPSIKLPTIDFSVDAAGRPMPRGTIVADQFGTLGMTVTSRSPHHPPMLFDSNAPTGGDDDLASPALTDPLAPDTGMVLILSEDGDAADPDDNAGGGTLVFTFDDPVRIDEIGVLDIEGAGNVVTLFDASDNAVRTIPIPATGDGGVGRVAIDATGVTRMELTLASSGAVTDLEFCRDAPGIPPAATRFFVADADRHAYRYDASGASIGSFTAPIGGSVRGVATTGDGNPAWIVTNNGQSEKVHVYDTETETRLGWWYARSLTEPEGIATDGDDVWIVDRGTDRVNRYHGGAHHRGGTHHPDASFALHANNQNPRGITTDGETIWVVDTGNDRVFVYDLHGGYQTQWRLDSDNVAPRGITIDPSGGDDVWVVDASRDKIFAYDAARPGTTGRQPATATFPLAPGNTAPQGIADPVMPLTFGQTLTDSVGVPGEIDQWTFDAAAGDEFVIRTRGLSGGGNLVVRVLDADGRELASENGFFADNWTDTFAVFATGPHRVVVSGFGDTTPDYELTLSTRTVVRDTADLGDTLAGTFPDDDAVFRYRYDLTAGQRLYFDVRSITGGDLWARLNDADGTLIGEARGTSDVAGIVVPADGSYELVLTKYFRAGATFDVALGATPADRVRLAVADRYNADLTPAFGGTDVWTFDAVAGDRYYVDYDFGTGTQITTSITRPDGTILQSGRDNLARRLDSGVFVASQTGTYEVRIGEPRTGRTVPYRVAVWDVPDDRTLDAVTSTSMPGGVPPTSMPGAAPPTPIVDDTDRFSLDRIVRRRLPAPGNVDRYRFEGSAGDRIIVDTTPLFTDHEGPTQRLAAALTGPDGDELFTIVPSGAVLPDSDPITLPADGTYTWTVRGDQDDRPDYQFAIRNYRPLESTAVAGEVVSGAIGQSGAPHRYAIDLTAGTWSLDRLSLSRETNTSSSLRDPSRSDIRILSPTGDEITVSAAGEFSIPDAGPHTVEITEPTRTSDESVRGQYAFRVRDADAPLSTVTSDDLVIVSVSDPVLTIDPDAAAPTVVSVTYTVRNDGDRPLPADRDWTDRITVSGDYRTRTPFERFAVDVQSSDHRGGGMLDVGDTYTATATFELPASYEGSFWTFVHVDADNAVYESAPESLNIGRPDAYSTVRRQTRPASDDGGIDTDPADGSTLPAGVPLTLSGRATPPQSAINVVFAFDVSTSLGSQLDFDTNADGIVDDADDINRDGGVNLLDAELYAIDVVTSALQTQTDNLRFAATAFAGDSNLLDASPLPGNQYWVDPTVDTAGPDPTPDFAESYIAARFNGIDGFRPTAGIAGTIFQPPVDDIVDLLADAEPADRTLVYFLTDGIGLDVDPLRVDGLADAGVEFYAFQVGGTAVTAELLDLTAAVDDDPSSVGVAVPVSDPTAIGRAFARTVRIDAVTVDGTPVDALDPAGDFFHGVRLDAGENDFEIVATTAAGVAIADTITLIGEAGGSSLSDFVLPAADVPGTFAATTYHRTDRTVHVDFLPPTRDDLRAAGIDDDRLAATLSIVDSAAAAFEEPSPGSADVTLGFDASVTPAPIPLSIANPDLDRYAVEQSLRTAPTGRRSSPPPRR